MAQIAVIVTKYNNATIRKKLIIDKNEDTECRSYFSTQGRRTDV